MKQTFINYGAMAIIFTLVGVSRAENLVVDAGFETTVNIALRPTDYGYWGGDYAEIVTVDNGIVPFEGSQMLQFINALPSGPSAAVGCTVWQLIDVNDFSTDISSGNAIAMLSSRFNRVIGDIETDGDFFVNIWACAGSPSTFPSLGTPLAYSTTINLYSDDDESTWELVETTLALPVDTEYVAIALNAQENIFNDIAGVEFDGHYADAVSLTIVPEPTTICLLSLGTLALWRRRD